MNPKTEAMKKRTKQFALDVLRFRRTLPGTDDARDIGRQLSRAATGVAAGYRSVCRSRSDGEFAARMGLALDGADESALWLEIITEDALSRTPTAFKLLDEAGQLTAMFAASCITVKQRKD